VPGELQVYWEFRRLIRKIGFVRQQDNGFASGTPRKVSVSQPFG